MVSIEPAKVFPTTNCSLCSHYEVFTEQPEPVLAPIGGPVQLNCSVVQGYGVRWLVILPSGGAISSVETDTLESVGIILTSLTTQESMLTVNGTEDINGTTIQCLATLLTSTSMRCPSEAVQVIFYGNT